jgi:hypothetical protein
MLAEVMHTALRRRSVELIRHERVGGRVYACVLQAVSLLGVQAPAVKGLADLRALFAAQLLAVDIATPERFSVLVGESDTPAVPLIPDSNPQREPQTTTGVLTMALKLNSVQKKALGIADDATDAEIAAALTALGLQAAGDPPAADADPASTPPVVDTPVTPISAAPSASKNSPATTQVAPTVAPVVAAPAEPLTPQAVAAAAGGLGLQVVDVIMFAQLQKDAQAGRAARDEQDSARRDNLVKDAVRRGKIAPAAFAAFRKQADSDESGLIVLLAAMPEILPTVAVGHGEQFTGDITGSDTVVAKTAADAKRAGMYAYFGIPTPAAAKG